MESENPSGVIAFDYRLTNAEFPDSFKNCLEENHVKIESEPVNANDKCSSSKLLRSQKRTKGCGEETSNKYIVSTDEDEPLKPRRKKRVLTQKQKDRRNALARVEALSEEQIEHRRARQRFCHKKWTPEQRQRNRLAHRKCALTPEQIERKNLRSKESYWRKRKKIQEQRMLGNKLGRIEVFTEDPPEKITFNDRLTNAEFPDSSKNRIEENHLKMKHKPVDANNVKCSSPELLISQISEQGCEENTKKKSFVSTDEQEPQQAPLRKRILTQEQKERYNASSRIEALSDEQIEHRRARQRLSYKNSTPEQRQRKLLSHRKSALTPEQIERKNLRSKEFYWRKRRKIQEQRELEEKSGRIETLTKMRQEINALQEQLEHIAEPNERRKLQRKVNNLNKKEMSLEAAINDAPEQILLDLHKKRLPLTAEQREFKRLGDIQYRLRSKKMMNSA